MRVSQRRSDVEIIADMLRIGENGAAKTRIMYNANMSYIQMKKYLHFLINQGYLDSVTDHNPSPTYHATERGLNLLKSIDSVMEILGLDDNY